MAKNNRYKAGSALYYCSECQKPTRETGAGESAVGMCRHCLEQAEWDNYVVDGGDPFDVPEEYQREGWFGNGKEDNSGG